MTDEEYLRNRLDRLNQNSHYGIMIDTEITDIVRSHIKRLEDNEMRKATSVQKIKNVKDICFTIENYPMEDGSKMTIIASTNDDIFAFEFEGQDLLRSCKAAGMFTGWEKDQKIRELQEENEKLKDELKQGNKTECENCLACASYEEMYRDLLDKLKKENKKLKEELHSLKILKKSNLPETPITDTMLVDDYFKLTKEIEKLTIEKAMLKDENEKLKKELSLEKAANEAQRKFIREYAGKDTEVQFNYAIDDAKEVSYVIVDKEEYNKNFEKWLNAQVENAPASTSRADILDQAKKCVCGQREQDYGTPESNFQLIADLWNGYLGEKTDNPVISVTPVDVSMMMALMKIARIRNGGGSGDSFVDLAGYAACGGEIWHGQKAKDQN